MFDKVKHIMVGALVATSALATVVWWKNKDKDKIGRIR